MASVLFFVVVDILEAIGVTVFGPASRSDALLFATFRYATLITLPFTIVGISYFYFFSTRYGVAVGIFTAVIFNQIIWLGLGLPLVTIGVPFWIIVLLIS